MFLSPDDPGGCSTWLGSFAMVAAGSRERSRHHMLPVFYLVPMLQPAALVGAVTAIGDGSQAPSGRSGPISRSNGTRKMPSPTFHSGRPELWELVRGVELIATVGSTPGNIRRGMASELCPAFVALTDRYGNDQEVCSAGGCHPTLSSVADLRCRSSDSGSRNRPSVSRLFSCAQMGAAGMQVLFNFRAED